MYGSLEIENSDLTSKHSVGHVLLETISIKVWMLHRNSLNWM